MTFLKRITIVMFTLMLCVPFSLETHAQSNTDALQNLQQQLNQKANEKQAVKNEMDSVQQEMQSISTYISQNKDAMAKTEQKIADTNRLIEQKKEEIVTLEDKILARKDVMKKRLVALQQRDDKIGLVISVFMDAKNLDDFIQRASAVSTLFGADKDILNAQQDDLNQIEVDKKEIDKQEQVALAEQKSLAKQQADLDQNLQKKQADLNTLQQQSSQIDQQITADSQQKANIQAQIKAAQDQILQQQAAARAAAQAGAGANQPSAPQQPSGGGQEFYVTATAYSWEDGGIITRLGYNIKDNPNMKLIAVDPSVIPLGKKVWVEGYGVAIAGDTGGAIVGNRIDVLMPSTAASNAWGRKTVKVVVLN
ncbi:3D domain-containing protein [Neobacillus massiliamazoniensis]|uniref:3D domain-containing protein n=1 Tax=Neobacillus massiliamazoniensis TaxID=1499688 RepID=A0A0U1NQ46_9BACI|nr:3D domain-containing protein [Neobacillus massiliamazoniensis]CRK80159.1 3D domain-containing protein [Neobacillus massiliamazoniensis]